MEKKPSINAANKVHTIFKQFNKKLTLVEIQNETKLEAPQVSMALCYLRRQRYLSREQITNPSNKGRRNIWTYTYHPERLEAAQ